jgi:hypothetical protein
MSKRITVTEAARMLDLTTSRVRQLLGDGSIAGEKVTGPHVAYWMVRLDSVVKHGKNRPKLGRPKKNCNGA